MSDRPPITGSNCIHCGSARLPWIVCDDCGKSQGEAFAAEIASLRARLERAREGLEVYADETNWRDSGKRNFHGQIKYGPNDEGAWIPEGPVIAKRILRELENGGGDE